VVVVTDGIALTGLGEHTWWPKSWGESKRRVM